MNLKKTNTTLLTLVGLLLILAILVLIKILFSDAKGFEWGSVSDWFSVACNTIMAAAATYAAFNAKQWVSQRFHTKGLEHAENIIYRIDTCFTELIKVQHPLFDSLEHLQAINKKITFADSSWLEKYELLSSNASLNISAIDKLSNEISLISRWSIEIENENEEIIIQNIEAIRNAQVSASNAFRIARTCIYNSNFMDITDFKLSFTHFKKIYTEFEGEIDEAKNLYSNFRRKKFSQLFKVK